MTTNSNDLKALHEKINSFHASKTEEDLIREDEDILMANYLSEIERIQKLLGYNRKELAQQINITPSYLTQVFRGDKPLNFNTIAKIQRALNVRFQVNTIIVSDVPYSVNVENSNVRQIKNPHQYTYNTYSLDRSNPLLPVRGTLYKKFA